MTNEDCISREAVHDLMATWLSDYLLDETREALEVIDGKVEDLPSVTPKGVTVTDFADKCRECGKKKTKWIPCTERMPEKNVEVLATTIWDTVTIAEMYSANDWYIQEGASGADIDEIVAWMPLPERYKAESEVQDADSN